MKRLRLFAAVGLCIGLLIGSTSCRFDTSGSDGFSSLTTSSKDDADANDLFEEVEAIIEESLEDESVSGSGKMAGEERFILNDCAEITLTWTDNTAGNFPVTIAIDFGSGCNGLDGVERSGIIHAELTGPFYQEGSTASITFDNYQSDHYGLDGTKRLINNGNGSFTIQVEDATITNAEGESFSWESDRTRTQVSGQDTPGALIDDVFEITGTTSGVNREGGAFSATIIEPLRKNARCKWIAKGILELKPANKIERTIDFGDGACDRWVTVTIQDEEYRIPLR